MNAVELAEYNAAILRSREEYERDPFAASRLLHAMSINGLRSTGRISREEAAAMRAEMKRW